MASPEHIPVLLADVVAQLAPRAGGTYVDGTFGRGGHARAVLEALGPAGRLIAIDRDPAAIAAATALAAADPRVTVVHGRFGAIPAHLAAIDVATVDGVLLDLGVSSPQLDDAARGFSFTREGPIDMRMDTSHGPTALELIRATPVGELAAILRDFGEERLNHRIARRLKDAERDGALTSTLALANTIAACFSGADLRKLHIHPATRTFQALRIAVNGELDELAEFLAVFPDLLAPGGRCAIISFHSLEDRLVKRRFRDLAWTSSLPPRFALEAGERVEAVCVPIERKARFANDDEADDNPRARSARLRTCERTTAPNLPSHR
ncbi:MAG: 16S rRNA (cytosine(1402)-N(4))-methyltransferase RsmH [Myxococcales bacterium]|nr:16S rRNA (cytosine(1402)-N(4))-methyltransferase RsmH [Myxococcales bacterium]